MDIFADLRRRVAAIVLALVGRGVLPPGLDPDASSAVPAPAGAPFDAVIDAALVHARAAAARGLDPRAFARLLAAEIALEPSVDRVEATDRGFVNVVLRSETLAAALAAILAGGLPGPAPLQAWPEGWSLAAARAAAVGEALAALDTMAGRSATPLPGIGPVSVRRSFGPAAPAGGAVGLREAAGVCGAGPLRFALAAAEPGAPLALDLDALADRWRGNPAFWVPYAHARCRAALRRAAARRPGEDLSPSALVGDAVAHLDRAVDRRALRAVLGTPWVVSGCAASRSARRLAVHLVEVADAAHVQSSASTYQPQSRFVNEEQRDCAGVRLGLVSASALVLEFGLGILGLTAPDEVL